MVAACLRNDGVLIDHLTAAQLWNLRRLPKDSNIRLLVPHGCTARFDGYVVRQTRRIDPIDIVHRSDGIRLISPTRTVLEIADSVGDAVAASILEQVIDEGRGTLATHMSTLARLGHSRRTGTATLARVLGSRPAWRRAMQSDLEARVLAEISRQALPRPQVQHPVRLSDGTTIRLDFAWPEYREALEVDHPFWHAGSEESHRDKRRDRKAATIGWHTTRITDLDVEGDLVQAVTDVGMILALVTGTAT